MDYAVNPVKEGSSTSSEPGPADLHNFGMSVQVALGPKVLDGKGIQGRVLLSFSLGVDGSLMGVRITKSSGHHELDSQALKIVGKASFPTPPANLSMAHRTYVSAFTFT
jgi:TonB family protein